MGRISGDDSPSAAEMDWDFSKLIVVLLRTGPEIAIFRRLPDELPLVSLRSLVPEEVLSVDILFFLVFRFVSGEVGREEEVI